MYEFSSLPSSVNVASLSDEDLARGIVANEKDTRLVDELWCRTNSAICKAAKYACSKVETDFAMDDALSEAYVAAWKALPLYNARKGASLKTYLGNKVKYHILELDRQDKIRTGRNVPYGEECEEDDDGTPRYGAGHDELYQAVSERQGLKNREAELAKIFEQVSSLVTKPKHRACLGFLRLAYMRGEESPVQYAASRLGCSRQQVYNILKRVRASVPDDLAEKVLEIL
jgi:RNA polymerase sigma factor (sigma-70 family)